MEGHSVLGKGSPPQEYTCSRSWISTKVRSRVDLGPVLGSLTSVSIAKVSPPCPPQEDDLDGIHIVAFAEETDPGEGGILDWIWGRGGGTGERRRWGIYQSIGF